MNSDEQTLRNALNEYFEAKKREGELVEDTTDKIETILSDIINQQFASNPI